MAFDSRQVPGGDLWQIFVNDPNGVMIELNYEAAKERRRGGAGRARGRHRQQGSLLSGYALWVASELLSNGSAPD